MMPTVTLRKGTSKINLNARPKTAPAPDRVLAHADIRTRIGLTDSPRMQIPQIRIPKLSEAAESCPYNPTTYHSFPSIEKKQCEFCGLRPPSRATFNIPASNKPCNHCRSKSPFSHLASTFKRPRNPGSSNLATESSIAQLIASPPSSDEGPRIVPAAIAAKRIGNPPRNASLPGGRLPSYNQLRIPSAEGGSTLEQYGGRRYSLSDSFSKASSSITAHNNSQHKDHARPVSPRLHHLDIIPGAKEHPYVHKHEVDAHMAALRAGAPSPLRRSIDEAHHSANTNVRGMFPDYSRTVFYGTTTSSASTRRLSPDTIMQQVHARGTIVIEEGRRGGIPLDLNVELVNSGVYRRRSPQEDRTATPQPPRRRDDDDSFSTLTTQTPSTVGGTRLELKGGTTKPRLRGGGDRRFRFTRWLLTCRAHDPDSDDDLPPPRTPAPERIARAVQRSRGTATLPLNLSRSSTERSTTAPSLAVHHATPAVTPLPEYLRSHPHSDHSDLPVTQSDPDIEPLLLEQSGPSLRGGAGSEARLTPTLYWLAGGKGKPITVSSWQKQKKKKRTGGLLGMALYGAKYCQAYDEHEDREEDAASLQVETGSVKVSVDGITMSAKSSGGSVRSEPLASSSSSSSARAAAETPALRSVQEEPAHVALAHEGASREASALPAVSAETVASPTDADGAPHTAPIGEAHENAAEGDNNTEGAGQGNVEHGAQERNAGPAARSRSI